MTEAERQCWKLFVEGVTSRAALPWVQECGRLMRAAGDITRAQQCEQYAEDLQGQIGAADVRVQQCDREAVAEVLGTFYGVRVYDGVSAEDLP